MNGETAPREAVCWAVSDGRAGIEAQALALAEAIAELTPLRIERKRIAVRAPWRHLPWRLWGDGYSRLAESSDALDPPFPDLWIGCGRLSVPLTIAARRRSPSTFTAQIQDPRAPLSLFDVVIPPAHDAIEGDNVLSMIGSPSRVRALAPDEHGYVAGPINQLAVMVGGPNRAFSFDQKESDMLADQLRSLADKGVRLQATTSRRTPAHVADHLKARLQAAGVDLFRHGVDAPERNPYPAMLDDCDAILVTEDSVNMAMEAAATGKPVFIAALPRKPFASAVKFERFHESLRRHGATRAFDGELEAWSYPPLDETRRVAAEVLERWRRGASRMRVR